MSEFVFKLPDLGEGTVEAEIIEWHVKVGAEVREGDVMVDVMTDKANIEVPAPVDGRILRTTGQPGDVVAVGSELVALETSAPATAAATPRPKRGAAPPAAPAVPAASFPAAASERDSIQETKPVSPLTVEPPAAAAPDVATRSASIVTSPALRKRAKEAGIDLHEVPGTGPRGRILKRDLDAYLQTAPTGTTPAARAEPAREVEEIKVIGIRRLIAGRVSQSKHEIPHFAYVEEVDVTELDKLRQHLNATHQQHLSVLPFIALGLIRALAKFPQCNALFDAAAGVIRRHRAVHLGVATQTPDGLKVPVVRNAQNLNLWQLAAEITRLAEAARTNQARREELVGSTITITSLGRMGGIVTTPVINYPEMSIIGVNKAVERPMVLQGKVAIRTMMNLSSCFDHRFIDGFDAAALIQEIKASLENPATLFLDEP